MMTAYRSGPAPVVPTTYPSGGVDMYVDINTSAFLGSSRAKRYIRKKNTMAHRAAASMPPLTELQRLTQTFVTDMHSLLAKMQDPTEKVQEVLTRLEDVWYDYIDHVRDMVRAKERKAHLAKANRASLEKVSKTLSTKEYYGTSEELNDLDDATRVLRDYDDFIAALIRLFQSKSSVTLDPTELLHRLTKVTETAADAVRRLDTHLNAVDKVLVKAQQEQEEIYSSLDEEKKEQVRQEWETNNQNMMRASDLHQSPWETLYSELIESLHDPSVSEHHEIWANYVHNLLEIVKHMCIDLLHWCIMSAGIRIVHSGSSETVENAIRDIDVLVHPINVSSLGEHVRGNPRDQYTIDNLFDILDLLVSFASDVDHTDDWIHLVQQYINPVNDRLAHVQEFILDLKVSIDEDWRQLRPGEQSELFQAMRDANTILEQYVDERAHSDLEHESPGFLDSSAFGNTRIHDSAKRSRPITDDEADLSNFVNGRHGNGTNPTPPPPDFLSGYDHVSASQGDDVWRP